MDSEKKMMATIESLKAKLVQLEREEQILPC